MPDSLIYCLEEGGAGAFAAALVGNSDSPELIWTHAMRQQRLIPQMLRHLGDFPARLREHGHAVYEYTPCPPVGYPEIEVGARARAWGGGGKRVGLRGPGTTRQRRLPSPPTPFDWSFCSELLMKSPPIHDRRRCGAIAITSATSWMKSGSRTGPSPMPCRSSRHVLTGIPTPRLGSFPCGGMPQGHGTLTHVQTLGVQSLLGAWRAELARKPLSMTESEACSVLGVDPDPVTGRVEEDALKSAYRRCRRGRVVVVAD